MRARFIIHGDKTGLEPQVVFRVSDFILNVIKGY